MSCCVWLCIVRLYSLLFPFHVMSMFVGSSCVVISCSGLVISIAVLSGMSRSIVMSSVVLFICCFMLCSVCFTCILSGAPNF